MFTPILFFRGQRCIWKGQFHEIRQSGKSSQWIIEEESIQKKGQRSSLVFGGQNVFNSLPRLLFFARTILKNMMNSSFSLNHPGAIHPIFQIVLVQNSWHGSRQGIEKFLSPKQQRRPLPFFCLYPSSTAYDYNFPQNQCWGSELK